MTLVSERRDKSSKSKCAFLLFFTRPSTFSPTIPWINSKLHSLLQTAAQIVEQQFFGTALFLSVPIGCKAQQQMERTLPAKGWRTVVGGVE